MGKAVMTLQTDKTLCKIVSEGNRQFSAEINGESGDRGTYDEAWDDIKEYIDLCLYPSRLTNKKFGMLTVPPTCYEDFVEKFGVKETAEFFISLTQEISARVADKLKSK